MRLSGSLGLLVLLAGLSLGAETLNKSHTSQSKPRVVDALRIKPARMIDENKNETDALTISEINRKHVAAAPEKAPEKNKPKTPQKKILSSRSKSLKALTGLFVATAYDPGLGGMNGSGITATGTRVTFGVTIAVDPNVIPLGSEVEIRCSSCPSINGVYTAQDTGGAIIGHRIDIALNGARACYSFGRRVIQVTILRRGY